MTNKKDLIITALLSFCLTATLFGLVPTQSSPVGEYDPWRDINDDGEINILDIASVAQSYGASGNPTKNVTVTNFQSQYSVVHFHSLNVSWQSFNFTFDGDMPLGPYLPVPLRISGYVGGYSRMTVLWDHPGENASQNNYTATFWVDFVRWKDENETPYLFDRFSSSSISNIEVDRYYKDPWNHWIQTSVVSYGIIETKGPYFRATIFGNSTVESGWVILNVAVYLRNE